MGFTQMKRENVWLRMLLMAPTGGGKTVQSLRIATTLFGGALPVALLDSEHGRAKLYADKFPAINYDQLTGDFSPEAYLRKAREAEAAFPGGVLILDSISHEWMGKKGILQEVDRFGDWKKVRPRHNDFIEGLLELQMHLIVTVRAKMKYEVSEQEVDGRTRQVINKLGVGPVQSDDIIYEFDVVGMIDAQSHDVTFSNRCDPLVDTTRQINGEDTEVADILTEWLSQGEPPAGPPEAEISAVEELCRLLTEDGITADKIEQGFVAARSVNRGALHPDWVADKIEQVKARLQAKAEAQGKNPETAPAAEPAAEPEAATEPAAPETSAEDVQPTLDETAPDEPGETT